MRDLEKMLTKFNEIVSPNFCNTLARECGLVQRSTSRLQGYELAQAMIIPHGFLETETLNSLAARMQTINKTCDLSASALSQRLNTPMAKNFMEKCLAETLRTMIHEEYERDNVKLEVFEQFSRVLVEDSTTGELHEKLSPHFKGSGGAASKAAFKINYIFDFQSGRFVDMHLCSGNIPDQKLASRIMHILEKKDLVIRDLGYFAVSHFKRMEELGAYYISRGRVDLEVYDSPTASEPLDLAKFIGKQMERGTFDKEVFIGKERHKVRMVVCEMNEAALNKRLMNANKTAKRRGTEISAKKRALLKYSIFITNIPKTLLCSRAIMAIYRARWKIELIFKQWKSCLKLHVFKGYNLDHFYSVLYGRLIMILLLGKIYPILMQHVQENGRELSEYKLTMYLVTDNRLAIALQEGKISEFTEKLLENILRRLCLDKRKRLSLRENVKQKNVYCNTLKMNELKIA